MISDGFIASALFFSIGFLYERYKTKLIIYYSSLATTMPIFSFLFFIFILANIAFPSTTGFIGEFFVLVGAFSVNFLAAFFAAAGVVFSAAYSLWLFNRICFGAVSTKYVAFYQDINNYEACLLLGFVVAVFGFGLFPNLLFDYVDYFVYSLSLMTLFK